MNIKDTGDVKLKNRTALITGATKGIGRAIALEFAREGAHIAATGRTESELHSLEEAITALGGKCATVCADLSDHGAVEFLWDQLTGELGDIHILVNNAGIGSSADPQPVLTYEDAFWENMIYVNLTVPYLLCKKVLPQMIQRKHGRIIQTASINGKIGSFHGAAYAASKHGLLGLTRTLAGEVAGDGITVNALCPGPVATLVNDKRVAYDAKRMGRDFAEQEKTMTPMGRRLRPEEVAPLAVYLASDAAASMTGQAINIDGGVLMAG